VEAIRMSAPLIGVLVGGVLGLFDGLSAWLYPEARPMMITIVVGSTVKGVLTGLAAGLVARWRKSLGWGVGAGIGVGFVLSTLAALGQPGHYWAIVMPGMLVGALSGVATQRVRRGTTVAIALCLVVPAVLAHASQPSASNQSLATLDPFIGRWQGTSEGQPGTGTVEREYTRILNSRFVRVTNHSVYPPQARNPKGEQHEDVGIFSVDTSRQRIVFRQFHVEGFVHQYVQETASADRTLVFVTESIENIPSGWRAREAYHLISADEFEEVFELAEPGKPFEVYSRARLKRAK
jgi:THAP4-like, heme-binding beta-barrel domain